jgi:hypothetical protein
MLGSNDQTPENERGDSLPSLADQASGSGSIANGTPGQPAAPAAAANAGPDSPGAIDPAVARVDGVANRVGYLAAHGTRKFVSLLSRTREAVQDFWAEVQDYRHGRKP